MSKWKKLEHSWGNPNLGVSTFHFCSKKEQIQIYRKSNKKFDIKKGWMNGRNWSQNINKGMTSKSHSKMNKKEKMNQKKVF